MFAVIFKAQVRELDPQYHETVQRMRELAMRQYRCIDFISFSEGDHEISISYWQTQECIAQWRSDPEHLEAQALGRQKWYKSYQVEIVEIIREYTHSAEKT